MLELEREKEQVEGLVERVRERELEIEIERQKLEIKELTENMKGVNITIPIKTTDYNTQTT